MITEKLIERANELRERGYSYAQISSLLGVPKSTAWYLINDPDWLKGRKKRLEKWREEQGIDYESKEESEPSNLKQTRLESEEIDEEILRAQIEKILEEKRMEEELKQAIMKKVMERERAKKQMVEMIKLMEIQNLWRRMDRENENSRFWNNLFALLLLKSKIREV
jgi:hypothetical protein